MGGWLTWLPAPRRPLAGPSVISTNVPDATVKRMRLPRRTALPARQCPGELAYRLLMLLVPDFGKVAGDLKLHTLVQRDLPPSMRGCGNRGAAGSYLKQNYEMLAERARG